MTLNLMLTSRDAVYLSADFRLTSTKDHSSLSDSYDTQKLIPVLRRDWFALIAYTGVASAPPLIKDVGQWILEQVEAIPHDGDISQLSCQLLKFDAQLHRILGDRRIAFSVVGFSDQRPFMLLLSNFIDASGRLVDTGPQLRAYLRRSRSPEVRAVGTARPDVFERVRLERLLQARSSRRSVAELTCEAVAEINGSVARRSKGSISEECVIGYLLRTGSAAIGAYGVPADAACFPNWVQRDLEKGGIRGFECMVLPLRWTGTTVRTFEGAIVRMHEIVNAGEPIFNEIPPASACHIVRSDKSLRLFLGPEETLRRMGPIERNRRHDL